MKYHWSSWLIIGGLGLDLIDALTSSAGSTGGIVYGTSGFLNALDTSSLPLIGANSSIHIGEVLAMVGVAIHLVQRQPA